jgi:diguanylate cyclase (GGDEF)-like protein
MPFFSWPSYFNICLAILVILLALEMVIFIWRHRNFPGAIFFLGLAFIIALWAFFYLMVLVDPTLKGKIFWEDLCYSVIVFVPLLYLYFILNYLNRDKQKRINYWAILLLGPIAVQILIWSPGFSGLFRTSAVLETNGLNFPGYLISAFGIGFWVVVLLNFALILIDLLILIISYFHTQKWSRNRYMFLMVGLFLPWCVAIMIVPHWITMYRDVILILTLAISMFIITWGLVRAPIFNLLPIARDAVLDQISDAVVVIDLEKRILDFNQAARNFSVIDPIKWIGKPFIEMFPELKIIEFNEKLDSPKDIETTLFSGNKQADFDIRISPLQGDVGVLSGWLIIFHNITQRKSEERKLKEAEARIENSLRDLQEQSREVSIMRNTTGILNQAASLRAALIPTLKTIQEILPSDQIWLCLCPVDLQNHHREIFYHPDSKQSPLRFYEDQPNNINCLNDLISGALLVPKTYPVVDPATFAEEIKSGCFLSFPLRSGHTLIGIVNISIAEKQVLEKDMIHLVSTVCTSLSATLNRVSLLKSEYNEHRLSETFRQINAKLTASLNLNDVLDILLVQISRLVPMDAGCIMLIDDNNARITRLTGYAVYGKKTEQAISQFVFPISTTGNINEVVSTKKPYIVPDTLQIPNWQVNKDIEVFRSWIGCPVIIDNSVFLIFSLDKKEANFFTGKHAEYLTSFCAEVSLAIQNARLYEAGQKRIQELVNLQSTMNDISSQLDTQTLFEDIMKRALQLLNSDSGMLALYQKEQDNFLIAKSITKINEFEGKIFKGDSGLFGMVRRELKPMTIEDYSSWEYHIDEFIDSFPHAVLEVPLLAGENFAGILVIGDSTGKRKYNDDDIRLLTIYAQQATIALTNAQLFADARQRAEEAETLRQASAIVASTLKQKQALHLILEQLIKVVPYDSASILLLREGKLELVEGHGFTENSSLLGLRLSLDQNQPGTLVFKQKKPMVIGNMKEKFPAFYDYNHLPILSWIGVPLTFKNRTIGILSLDSMQENRYNSNHVHLASAFADQVAVALENIRLYENAVKSAKQFSSLYSLSQSINVNLQPQDLFKAIHKATKEMIPCDVFAISLFDKEKEMINDVYLVDKDVMQKTSSRPYGQGLYSKVIKENHSILYNNFDEKMAVKTRAVVLGEDDDDSLVKSLIIVPLRIGNQIKGVLSTQSYESNKFTEENKETLEMLASHSAIALENARLFNEIQELAMTDSLTKIFNRRKFYELAENEFSRSRRYNHPLSVIMMDIDKFKQVNDTYGHSAGDQVLTRIAEICNSSMRTIDILARYGGEEFVVMLPETTADEARLTAERMRLLVARTPIKIGESSIKVTLSFGVVELDKSCKNIEELMDRSDQAMYASKNSGRNRVTIWSQKMVPSLPGEIDLNKAGE